MEAGKEASMRLHARELKHGFGARKFLRSTTRKKTKNRGERTRVYCRCCFDDRWLNIYPNTGEVTDTGAIIDHGIEIGGVYAPVHEWREVLLPLLHIEMKP